jgi:hypothetical protein
VTESELFGGSIIKELKDVRFPPCFAGTTHTHSYQQLPTQVLEFMRNFYQVFPELAGTDVGSSSLSHANDVNGTTRPISRGRVMPANTYPTSQTHYSGHRPTSQHPSKVLLSGTGG